jgi:quinol monooxygenase YgiN
MSTAVSWNLRVSVIEGRLEAGKALMDEMVAATETDEPGTLAYECFLSDDGATCHIYERYADSDATMVHPGNFGSKFAERFMGCFAPTGIVVYGAPSDAVQGVLDGFGAVYMGMWGGFSR